jgi:transcriptional regulator, araC family
MKIDDLKYLSTTIGNLAGVPIRIYKNKTKIFYYSFVKLPKDPIIPYNERVLDISEHVGYFITPRFHYYGVVNSGEYKIVLGPSRQWTANKTDLTELAFECDVPQDETEEFVNAMENLVALPLDSVLQTLCSVNFVLNKEKLSLADITIYDDEQQRLSEKLDAEQTTKHYDSEVKLSNDEAVHNTLTLEQTIMNFVRHGDVSAMKEWIKSAPAVRPGKLSSDTLRQLKNTFIVTATLVSRSAIRGGMDANDALSLSDAYIQKCELLSSVEAIVNLQFHMVLEYTERVERLKLGKTPTKLLTDIANYVQKHLTEPVNIEALSKAVFVSRTHLAVKFKKETGMTLTEFVLKEKIEEGKRLLRYTDKSLSAIAAYLGFSSQSHFSNVFRKYAGYLPSEYRLKHIH